MCKVNNGSAIVSTIFGVSESFIHLLIDDYASPASFCLLASSSWGVLVVSCNAWMPPSRASSSFMSVLTIRCRASCIFPSKAEDVITRLLILVAVPLNAHET
jgi:hypothetical protein